MKSKHKFLSRIYLLSTIFQFLQKNSNLKDNIKNLHKKEDETTDFNKIRCPKCKWQPKASSLWYCIAADYPEYFYEACGNAWNTFDTRGKCPGCNHQWRWTSCLSCTEWSLHEDWYEIE